MRQSYWTLLAPRGTILRAAIGTSVVVLATACDASESRSIDWGFAASELVYQQDDRVEALQYFDPTMVQLCTSLVGAIIPVDYVLPQVDGTFMLDGPSLEQRGALCAEEPMIEQPSLALCTGILAQENTLITAGHCLRGDLEKLVFVQGYVLGHEYPVVAAEQVHHILEILTSVDRDIAAESGADFAVAQLAGETKLPEVQFPEQAWTPTLGERVVVMGTSEGLPLKIEDGGSVFDARAQDYFEVTSDTFAGGSGSPVFTSEGTFRGVLVGGAEDYRWDLDRQCYVRRRLEEPTGRGEIVVRAEVLKAALAVALEAEAASHASASCGFSGRSPNGRWLGWIWITMAVTIGATARMLIRYRQ